MTITDHERRLKALEERRFAPTEEFWSLAGWGVLWFLFFTGLALMNVTS